MLETVLGIVWVAAVEECAGTGLVEASELDGEEGGDGGCAATFWAL